MHMSSRRLWMMQGFHTLSHAEPSVGAAMRALNQKGVRYGYFQTTPMARLLPEAAASGTLVAAALARAAGRLPPSRGIGAEAAARAVGYEELGPGERRRGRGHTAALAAPELGSCASARRALWLWAARHSRARAGGAVGEESGRPAAASAARASRAALRSPMCIASQLQARRCG